MARWFAATVGGLPLDHRRRCLAGEPCSVQEVVVRQDAYHPGPLQGGQRRLDGTPQGVIEREQPGCFTRAQHEVGEPFGPVGKGADEQRLGGGHGREYTSRTPGVYSGIRTGKPACTWNGRPTTHLSGH